MFKNFKKLFDSKKVVVALSPNDKQKTSCKRCKHCRFIRGERVDCDLIKKGSYSVIPDFCRLFENIPTVAEDK